MALLRSDIIAMKSLKRYKNLFSAPISSVFTRTSSTMRSGPVLLSYNTYENPKVSAEAGPPLIIIHGLFGSKRNWGSLAKVFAKSGRKIITVDCRNHGASPHVDLMDYHVMSEDIAHLMAELRLEKASVLGHSMGGKVAMTLALTQPSLLDKLIIEDILPEASATAATEFPAYIETMRQVDFTVSGAKTLSEIRQDVDQQLKKVFQEVAIRSFILTNIEAKADGSFGWNVNVDAIAKNAEHIFGFPRFDTTYDKETLFIGGSLSQHFSVEKLPMVQQLFPAARMETIQYAGHWVHAEQPHAFAHAVTDFLSSKQ